MRKILLSVLLLFCVSGLFALDYPEIMNNGTIFINAGVGFGKPILKTKTNNKAGIDSKMLCPPLTVSFDIALPIAGLPLTLGIITGFFSEESDLGKDPRVNDYSFWPIAARIAYHFAFRVPRLDTYALLTLGAAVSDISKFWIGISAGARYFFLPYMGAYLELGIDEVQLITFGLSFKL